MISLDGPIASGTPLGNSRIIILSSSLKAGLWAPSSDPILGTLDLAQVLSLLLGVLILYLHNSYDLSPSPILENSAPWDAFQKGCLCVTFEFLPCIAVSPWGNSLVILSWMLD